MRNVAAAFLDSPFRNPHTVKLRIRKLLTAKEMIFVLAFLQISFLFEVLLGWEGQAGQSCCLNRPLTSSHRILRNPIIFGNNDGNNSPHLYVLFQFRKHCNSSCLTGTLITLCDGQVRFDQIILLVQIRTLRLGEVEFLDQDHMAKCESELDRNLTFLILYLFFTRRPV